MAAILDGAWTYQIYFRIGNDPGPFLHSLGHIGPVVLEEKFKM